MAVASELMYFQYGPYIHPRGEVNLSSVERVFLKTDRGNVWGERRVLHLQGEICYDPNHPTITDPQDQLNLRIQEINAAYSTNFYSGGMRKTNGELTDHWLDSPASESGVTVDYISFPRGAPDEFATGRTFHITLSATFLKVPEPDSYIVEFRETLERIGNGDPAWKWVVAWLPRKVGVRTVAEPVEVQQIIRPWTPVWFLQTGHIVGLTFHPIGNIPPPVFGVAGGLGVDWEHTNQQVVVQHAPQWVGNTYLFYPVSWRYVMEAPPSYRPNQKPTTYPF